MGEPMSGPLADWQMRHLETKARECEGRGTGTTHGVLVAAIARLQHLEAERLGAGGKVHCDHCEEWSVPWLDGFTGIRHCDRCHTVLP